MESLISVIIPIYNVENYLERCIDSVTNQTYKKLEIILVDDGSPDRCGSLCDNYAIQDSRIKVIHKKNGGLSSARNAGLDIATGDYIGFVDSDDWIENEMFEKLIKAAEREKADVVQCGYRSVLEDEKTLREYSFLDENYYKNEDVLSAYFTQTKISVVVWNKLYRRDLFSSIRMVEGHLYEDIMVSFELVLKTKRFVSVEGCFYNYLQRKSSIMGNNFSNKKLDMLHAGNYVVSKCEINTPQFINQAHILLCMYCFYLYYELLFSEIDNKFEYKRIIVTEFFQHFKIVKYSKEFKNTRINNKILIKTFSINKYLAVIIYRLYCQIRTM